MSNLISVVILTKDEESNIKQYIENLRWCKEILVIDDNSKDKTVEIAKRLGAKVFVRPLNNDFCNQRNFGLMKAGGAWVLFIDADEAVGEALKNEILGIILNPLKNRYNGFLIKRKDYMWGRELKHGELGNVKLMRLAKKDAGNWQGKVHEVWKIKGKIGELNNSIKHYPHQSIREFLKEINFYTDIKAKELYENGFMTSFLSVLFFPIGKFFLNYIIRYGFMDGTRGLIFAILMSLHSFLVRSKLFVFGHKI